MHRPTHNLSSGKASVWIAWLTTLLSVIFIVLIVNRDAIYDTPARQMGEPLTAQAPLTLDYVAALPLPEIDVSIETIGITKDGFQSAPAASHQALYARELSQETATDLERHTRFRTPLDHPDFFSSFESTTPSVDIVTEAAPKLTFLKSPDLTDATAERVTGSYDTSPSVAALERSYRASPRPVPVPAIRLELRPAERDDTPVTAPFTSDHSDLELARRLQDTRVRLYLSEFKVAIYEGQSRASLRDAWTEIRALLEADYLHAADLRALELELSRVERALSNRASAHTLIGAVDALHEALDALRQPSEGERGAGMQPF